jgi:hypothetical protein
MLLFAFLPLLFFYSPIMKKMLRVDPINTCEISEILLNRMRKKKKKNPGNVALEQSVRIVDK